MIELFAFAASALKFVPDFAPDLFFNAFRAANDADRLGSAFIFETLLLLVWRESGNNTLVTNSANS